jgi:DNA adenine methylase
MTAPPFAYYGGKTMLAGRIADLLPAHQHYVEPFAGSLAVLLAKPRARIETVNDLDGDLMTFWRVLRDEPEKLARVCGLTPHSRAEHQLAYDLDVSTDLERARRVWVLLTQGRGGTLNRTGWRYVAKPSVGISMPDFLCSYVGRMSECAKRLSGVSLEARDAPDVIGDYGRHEEVLIYADPPYPGGTRSSRGYRVEMHDEQRHRELAAALHECRATVVLSGYASDLYAEVYGDWYRQELTATTNQGFHSEGADPRRVEVLWSNRPLAHPNLFDGVAM